MQEHRHGEPTYADPENDHEDVGHTLENWSMLHCLQVCAPSSSCACMSVCLQVHALIDSMIQKDTLVHDHLDHINHRFRGDN